MNSRDVLYAEALELLETAKHICPDLELEKHIDSAINAIGVDLPDININFVDEVRTIVSSQIKKGLVDGAIRDHKIIAAECLEILACMKLLRKRVAALAALGEQTEIFDASIFGVEARAGHIFKHGFYS